MIPQPQFFVGVDPDTSTSGVAIVDQLGRLAWAGTVGRANKLNGLDAVQFMLRSVEAFKLSLVDQDGRPLHFHGAVEMMDASYTTRSGKSIIDLMLVAPVAGAFHLKLLSMGCACAHLVYPRDWKGSVPKGIHHGRILNRLQLPFQKAGGKDPKRQYAYPTSLPFETKKGEWKHLTDAAGLALYARDEYHKAAEKLRTQAELN